ncbi:MAG: type II 3-dehydroquinate dehydratase [Bacteroidia bacterium]|nr:type II 3-dehydroquinate dehydratase [Bacteroidia bacterium]
MQILIINGPNLNMLGLREPHIYGRETFEEVLTRLRQTYPGTEIGYFQSNHEGAITDRLQAAYHEPWNGLIINGGALTHYSYVLHDALKMLPFPKVEVHISHIFAREAFRHQSVISPACDGMISGLGTTGYELALRWLLQHPSA